ncbi:MAG: chemotaxis response regulator protein-glutamate methylesterase [Bdellovibrio sp.]|nr:chemotaxis response regulator protein-glutamate methylesterase [Bdellovibrio sp.]
MTSPLPLTIRYGEILDPSIDRACQIILEQSVFLSASVEGKCGACGVLLCSEKISSTEYIQEISRQFAKLMNAHESDLQWKVIASDMNLLIILNTLRARQGAIVKEITKRGTADLWFWPAAGKLRISKSAPSKIRVMIVDDSKTIRNLLVKILKVDSEIEVVGQAENPQIVEEMIRTTRPDVITLDVQMPGMDGVTLLKKIFPIYKIPTIMITSLTPNDGPHVLDALEAGAIDYIKKPEFKEIEEIAPVIREKIKMAAKANMLERQNENTAVSTVEESELDQSKLIVIGSSTGGTEALKDILIKLPAKIPPILIVQHIPPVFSAAFAQRLDGLCPFQVREAKDGDLIVPGLALVAPGGLQMSVVSVGNQLKIKISDQPPSCLHKPSVNVLFSSVAKHAAADTVGIILTGMGSDGAKGLLELRNNGAQTIAQDERSCVVFGMPNEAIKCGAVQHIVSLLDISNKILLLMSKRRTAA